MGGGLLVVCACLLPLYAQELSPQNPATKPETSKPIVSEPNKPNPPKTEKNKEDPFKKKPSSDTAPTEKASEPDPKPPSSQDNPSESPQPEAKLPVQPSALEQKQKEPPIEREPQVAKPSRQEKRNLLLTNAKSPKTSVSLSEVDMSLPNFPDELLPGFKPKSYKAQIPKNEAQAEEDSSAKPSGDAVSKEKNSQVASAKQPSSWFSDFTMSQGMMNALLLILIVTVFIFYRIRGGPRRRR